MGVRPSPVSSVSCENKSLESWSISELVAMLRSAYRTADFDKVEEALVARETRLEKEIDRKEKMYESLLEKLKSRGENGTVISDREAKLYELECAKKAVEGECIVWKKRYLDLKPMVFKLEKDIKKILKGDNRVESIPVGSLEIKESEKENGGNSNHADVEPEIVVLDCDEDEPSPKENQGTRKVELGGIVEIVDSDTEHGGLARSIEVEDPEPCQLKRKRESSEERKDSGGERSKEEDDEDENPESKKALESVTEYASDASLAFASSPVHQNSTTSRVGFDLSSRLSGVDIVGMEDIIEETTSSSSSSDFDSDEEEIKVKLTRFIESRKNDHKGASAKYG